MGGGDGRRPARRVVARSERRGSLGPLNIFERLARGRGRALGIIQGLRGHTTGYAVPTYVIDAPSGGGKVPVSPEYVLSRNADRVVIRNYEGKVFEYIEGARSEPRYKPSEDFIMPELV